jgi:hypothetical protein
VEAELVVAGTVMVVVAVMVMVAVGRFDRTAHSCHRLSPALRKRQSRRTDIVATGRR